MNNSSDTSLKARDPARNDGAPASTLEQLASAFLPSLAAGAARTIRATGGDEQESLADRGFRMAEARYRTLVELLPAITFMASFEEGLSEVYVSPQIEALLGYTQKEWVASPVLWYERLHPDDRERWNGEFAKTVASGEPLRSSYRFLARDGHVVWIHGEARIVRDEQGVPVFIHGMGFDITKMKEAEQRVIDYSEKLKEINRELEQFAYVSSHDLQEPLRTITSYSEVLTADEGDRLSPEARVYLNRVVQAARRMKQLIQALLEFSRVGRTEEAFQPVSLETALKDATGNLDAAIRDSGATVTHDELPSVMGIRAYLTALFQNLISNGIKFRSAQPPAIHVGCRRGHGEWVLSVRDNGLGIDPQYHERIFVIFQRLHPQKVYPGTGVGLAVCRKIVNLHGGRIWVESEPGKGSSFNFTLPERQSRASL